MNKLKHKKISLIFCLVFLIAVFMAACENGNVIKSKSFDFDLWGTWETGAGSFFEGSKIEITSNTIKVTGFTEIQAGDAGLDDSQRPFKGIANGVEYIGYSEEGKIFIEDFAPEGIPYTYSTVGNYPQTKLLKFVFGGREEILIYKE